MKRLVCLFLIMISFAAIAIAEVDLSTMTYSELNDLRGKINDEIATRTETGEANFFAGVYVVGKDIKQGQYSLSCTRHTRFGMRIGMFESMDRYYDYCKTNKSDNDLSEHTLSMEIIKTGDVYHLSLKEGDILLIERGDGFVQPIKYDWMM